MIISTAAVLFLNVSPECGAVNVKHDYFPAKFCEWLINGVSGKNPGMFLLKKQDISCKCKKPLFPPGKAVKNTERYLHNNSRIYTNIKNFCYRFC